MVTPIFLSNSKLNRDVKMNRKCLAVSFSFLSGLSSFSAEAALSSSALLAFDLGNVKCMHGEKNEK